MIRQLLRRRLDLDDPWVTEMQFELVDKSEVPEVPRPSANKLGPNEVLACFAPYLRFSLDSGADAFHLLRDRQDQLLRPLMHVARDMAGHQHEWRQLIPWPSFACDLIFRGVRLMSGIHWWLKRGSLHYRYNGRWNRAACVLETPNDLVLYFGAQRPALPRLEDDLG